MGSPEASPVLREAQCKLWVTWNQAATELIRRIAIDWHEAASFGISHDVLRDVYERTFQTFVFTKYVIVALVCSEKPDAPSNLPSSFRKNLVALI